MDRQALADGLTNFGRSALRSALGTINGPVDTASEIGNKIGVFHKPLIGSSQWAKDYTGETNLDNNTGRLGGLIGAAVPALLAGRNPNLTTGLLGLGWLIMRDKFLK